MIADLTFALLSACLECLTKTESNEYKTVDAQKKRFSPFFKRPLISVFHYPHVFVNLKLLKKDLFTFLMRQ